MNDSIDPILLDLKTALDAREEKNLSPLAALSRNGIRRREEALKGHRQEFATDADRVLHSRAYTRYIDKTQVFYMVENDHITHRVLHVQLVSKIARTVGRFLGLNEDLIEAIALGHDIGHPPFGHDGEKMLSRICRQHGLPAFLHNIQSVVFLDRIEKRGQGWNLTLQSLDGILCHDGEVHDRVLHPDRGKTFADLDREMEEKAEDPSIALRPMTLEGCLVRFADTVSYIGRDIEDAIELKLIQRSDIPDECRDVLGDTNGTIVYRLVEDLIKNGVANDVISFSPLISERLKALKAFNYEHIYMNPVLKGPLEYIEKSYAVLFDFFLQDVEYGKRKSTISVDFLDHMGTEYLETTPPPAKVRDFMAGMTDDYFLSQARLAGCEIG